MELLAQLGVTPADFDRIRRLPFAAAKTALEELKARVQVNWKRLAFELHPDRNGGDEEKTKLFTKLNQVRREFEDLQVQPPRMAPPVRVVWVQAPFGTSTGFTNTGSVTFNAYYAATIRPI